MDKKLAIISYSKSTGDTYGEQIRSLFSENMILEKICIDQKLIKNAIDADLVLIQSHNDFKIIRPFMKKNSGIVIADRTISKIGFEKIMSIPPKTPVLLFDENKEMAMEMITVIYQLGARHIDIVPIYPGSKEDVADKTIILLGNSKYIKHNVKNIINIGNSLLELSTVMDIGAKLNLLHVLQRQDIKKSYKEIVTTNFGLSQIISETNKFESELDILLQVLDDGIIGINASGVICIYNEGAENIIGFRKDEVMDRDGLAILGDIPFKAVLETLEAVKEKLMKINGYDVVVSVDPIIHSGKLYGAVAIVKKFSDIEKKQHKLRAQLIGKGHRAKYDFKDILGESEAIKKCKNISKRMAKSDSSIMISGESGTGKELFAQAIHNNSKRKKYQFVAVNCGALPESLLESELFGYEEGAFTGARKGGKPGLFELSHNGTLFLDEIGEMPMPLQMRLLRVLQEREVMRIGGDRLIKVNIRIITATNKNLDIMVKNGEFREDLFYRLNVLPLKVPSLRERKEDVLFLVDEIEKQFNSEILLTEDAKIAFINHSWKGNVRELKNYVEYFVNLGQRYIDVVDLPFGNEENLNKISFKKDKDDMKQQLIDNSGEKLDNYLFVLRELEKGYAMKNRMGRRTLQKLAKDNYIFLGEQEIRAILINLEKLFMVKIFRGRSGSVITETGIEVLKYFQKGLNGI